MCQALFSLSRGTFGGWGGVHIALLTSAQFTPPRRQMTVGPPVIVVHLGLHVRSPSAGSHEPPGAAVMEPLTLTAVP